ncbi:MAG TPA: tetratricopeptide repeat protein [Polyangia bacterium]|jgi:Flp pilus assembly protein TadD
MSNLDHSEPADDASYASDDASYASEEIVIAALASGGNVAGAKARLASFLGRHPACAEAHNDLGVLDFQAGDLKAAATSIDRALALRPDCARYHRNRALVLLNVGDTATALAALARSLMLDPKDPETLQVVGELEKARRASHKKMKVRRIN